MTRTLSTMSSFYTRWRWVTLSALVCMLLTGALIVTSFNSTLASAKALPVSTSAASHSCQASYSTAAQEAFYTDDFTITNTGSKPLHGWQVQILFAGKQVIIQSWNGSFSQRGNVVIVKNTPANAVVAPGASINPGFNAVWNDTTPAPSSIKLNGVTCSLV